MQNKCGKAFVFGVYTTFGSSDMNDEHAKGEPAGGQEGNEE